VTLRHARRRCTLQAVAVVLATLPASAQTVREIPLPLTALPAGVAVAPDGSVWISIMQADRLLRFDPASQRFSSFELTLQSLPRGLVVDAAGRVWFAATGRSYIGRLDPADRRVDEFALPSILDAGLERPTPWALALSRRQGRVWSALHSSGKIASVAVDATPVHRGFVVSEILIADPLARLDGIAVDREGRVWVAALGRDEVIRIDPATGAVSRLQLERGSRPRGVAAAPSGVWVALFGSGRVLRIDPATLAARAWQLGVGAAPTALTVDDRGAVWVADYGSSAIARLEPATGSVRSFAAVASGARVHSVAADARGRVWYVGAFSGRLGVIEP
jgi:streptogramin lyase